MSRRRRGRPVSGWLALDKPLGRGSTQVLGELKRLFDAQKAGHAGTLDPLASGCLPIAFGEATKTVPFMVDGRKIYRFLVRWGVETATDDVEGAALATSDMRPSAEQISALLPEFTGRILQKPPAFSAVKLDGERAYDLARDGEAVDLEPRQVEVFRLTLTATPDAGHAEFEAECGKGTYVRSLARDMGRRLGCHGHVAALRRLLVGPFGEEDLVPLDEIRRIHEAEGPDGLGRFLQPVQTALGDLPELSVDSGDSRRIFAGQPVLLRGRDAPAFSGPAFATTAGRLIAIGDVSAGEFAPRRVFRGA
jgi:tRNA pseudouridine55 synthase